MAKLFELLVPLDRDDGREAGWLAGFFDGEGTIKKNKNHPSGAVCIVQTMHNPGLIDEIRRVLASLGFKWSEAWVTPKAPHSKVKWSDRCCFTVNGGWRERYRFLAQIAPTRREKLEATLFGQLSTRRHDLENAEPAGLADVHWLETETGNYVVEGFCSSNSFADTYGILLERGTLKPRIYPATEDGTLKGTPVLLTEERWAEVKEAQRRMVNAQMLLNPIAGNEAMFQTTWLRTYTIRPTIMNIYIMVDPSKGRGTRSDRTAMAVIGVDVAGNKYLLDGYRHRMKLSERWAALKNLYVKWRDATGTQVIIVGYERYGKDAETEVISEWQERDGIAFELVELNWAREGGQSKKDRVDRLEPDVRRGTFYLPGIVYHPDMGGREGHALWKPWTEDDAKAAENTGQPSHPIGQIIYRPLQGDLKEHRAMAATHQNYRIVQPIKRRDENNEIYDLTRAFIEEMTFFPFSPKDDLIDAASRIYDLSPKPAVQYEAASLEPVAYADS
jgi:hypothetical protein